jgi:hypothetical protein
LRSASRLPGSRFRIGSQRVNASEISDMNCPLNLLPSSSAERGKAATMVGDPAQGLSKTQYWAFGASRSGSPNGLAGSFVRG